MAGFFTGCTYDELPCRFESKATSWVEIAELKTDYRLGDTIVFLQDYIPSRENGRMITFPSGADLSWMLDIRPSPYGPLSDTAYSIGVELGTLSAANYGYYKVTPLRNGNQYRVVVKIVMKVLGSYRIHLDKYRQNEAALIEADRYQNCYEDVDLNPRFTHLPVSEFSYGKNFEFNIVP